MTAALGVVATVNALVVFTVLGGAVAWCVVLAPGAFVKSMWSRW